MARHAAPNDRSFQRSLARAVGRAALLLAVVGGVVFGLTQLRDQRPEGGDTVLTDAATAGATEAGTAAAAPPPEPSAGPSEDPLAQLSEDPNRRTVPINPSEPAASPGTTPEAEATPGPVTPEVDPPAEVTLQVLRGTDDEDAFDAAVRDLRSLGYQVELIAVAGTGSPTTTVFTTEGNEAEAEALVDADARFGEVAPNDRFETPVDLHVLIGDDWEED